MIVKATCVICIPNIIYFLKILRPILAPIGKNIMQLFFNIYLVSPFTPKSLIDVNLHIVVITLAIYLGSSTHIRIIHIK